MIKKLTATAGASVLFLSMAVPALANVHRGHNGVMVGNMGTNVTTTAMSGADTGDNTQHMMSRGRQAIVTGNARSGATALANVNNTDVLVGCGCLRLGRVSVWNMGTNVTTTAMSGADTGDNTQRMMGRHGLPVHTLGGGQGGPGGHGGHGGSQFQRTGSATSTAMGDSWVNITRVRFVR